MNENDSTTSAGLDGDATPTYSATEAPEHPERAPRVFIVRPVNGSGARLIRAKTRAAVREHLTQGVAIEPATHEDLIEHLPAGVVVENAGSPHSAFLTIRACLDQLAEQRANKVTP